MSEHDKKFYNNFAMVLGGLVIFTIAVLLLARSIAAETEEAYRLEDPNYIAQKAADIAPVGEVNIEGQAESAAPSTEAEPVVAEAAPAAEPAAEGHDGKAVYDQVCMVCHMAGVAGAPKLGDAEAWAPRIAAGTDALYASSINGKGAMPPKGGRMDMSDDQVRAAVDYMVSQSGG